MGARGRRLQPAGTCPSSSPSRCTARSLLLSHGPPCLVQEPLSRTRLCPDHRLLAIAMGSMFTVNTPPPNLPLLRRRTCGLCSHLQGLRRLCCNSPSKHGACLAEPALCLGTQSQGPSGPLSRSWAPCRPQHSALFMHAECFQGCLCSMDACEDGVGARSSRESFLHVVQAGSSTSLVDGTPSCSNTGCDSLSGVCLAETWVPCLTSSSWQAQG